MSHYWRLLPFREGRPCMAMWIEIVAWSGNCPKFRWCASAIWIWWSSEIWISNPSGWLVSRLIHPYSKKIHSPISTKWTKGDWSSFFAWRFISALLCRRPLQLFLLAIGYVVGNKLRSFAYGLSRGRLARGTGSGLIRKYSRQIDHMSASFAWLSDLTLMILGGELKRREMLSGRFADALGNLYLASSALKRFKDNNVTVYHNDVTNGNNKTNQH